MNHAATYYDELTAATQNVSYGKVLADAKTFAVVQGRELLRKSLENVVQKQAKQIDQDEKKRRHDGALAAELDDIAESRRDKTQHLWERSESSGCTANAAPA